MKAVIYAGGLGTRMWPASRVKTPKQFNQMVGDKSTLELMYNDYLGGYISKKNIYVSTNKDYVNLVHQKLQINDTNIISEPAMRDLGPSVGYSMSILNLTTPYEPVVIVWSDDLIKKPKIFHQILDLAHKHLNDNPNQIIYIGQKPLFADQNKGWIHKGKVIKHTDGISVYHYLGMHYRPPLEIAKQYFKKEKHNINTGYYVTTPNFILNQYKILAPQMYKTLQQLAEKWGTPQHQKLLDETYPTLEKISFDDLITSKTPLKNSTVLEADLGWYGFGDWESIKEALQTNPQDTITHGRVIDKHSHDSLIYNFTDKLVTCIDLQSMLVVATEDVIMVAPKHAVPEIKKLLKEFEGTELEKYT